MESKFAKAFSSLKMVQTGTKATNETSPVLTVISIPNKFQINKLAAIEMGLSIGDRVRIFDNTDAENINERFFIGKTSEDDTAGAKLGRANSGSTANDGIDMIFNYSDVWACLLQGEAKSVALGTDALCETGDCVKGLTNSGKERYRATKSVKLQLEHAGVAVVDGVEFDLWALVGYKSVARTESEIQKDITKTSKEAASSTTEDSASDADLDEVEIDEEEEEEEVEE